MIPLLASHTAPPVSYPVQRSLWLARALVLYALLGGLALLAWGWQGAGTRQHAIQLCFAVVLWLAGCMLVWRFWSNGVHGVLTWTGQAWTLATQRQVSAVAGTLAVRMDLQAHLWLRWESNAGDAHWLWLEQRNFRERWSDLRRAVYSPAGTTVADALRDDHSA